MLRQAGFNVRLATNERSLMIQPQPPLPTPLKIGDKVPDFAARTTLGMVKFSDYRGRWLIFFSHPADFTPVCTTEFVALAKKADVFEKMGCALLGLSVDSLYAHIAWLHAIKEQFGANVSFPIVEDPSMAVGKAFGMIDEDANDSSAMRSSYFIDPEGVIQAITCYPYNVGRSVDEMIRLLAALQVVSDGKTVAPEGWQPGETLLNAPPVSTQGVPASKDWFCQKVKPA